MNGKFTIEPHERLDKFFKISNQYISLKVDYDDVNHNEVDAAAELIVEILNSEWWIVSFAKRLKEKAENTYNENDKYGEGEDLREEYSTFDEYWKTIDPLKDRLKLTLGN